MWKRGSRDGIQAEMWKHGSRDGLQFYKIADSFIGDHVWGVKSAAI